MILFNINHEAFYLTNKMIVDRANIFLDSEV